MGDGTAYEEAVYFDETYPGAFVGWSSRMELFIHEFVHTIELQLNAEDDYGLHNAEIYYSQKHGTIISDFSILGPYLRGEFESGSGKVGIPYSFWDGSYEGGNLLSLPSAIFELKGGYATVERKKLLSRKG